MSEWLRSSFINSRCVCGVNAVARGPPLPLWTKATIEIEHWNIKIKRTDGVRHATDTRTHRPLGGGCANKKRCGKRRGERKRKGHVSRDWNQDALCVRIIIISQSASTTFTFTYIGRWVSVVRNTGGRTAQAFTFISNQIKWNDKEEIF